MIDNPDPHLEPWPEALEEEAAVAAVLRPAVRSTDAGCQAYCQAAGSCLLNRILPLSSELAGLCPQVHPRFWYGYVLRVPTHRARLPPAGRAVPDASIAPRVNRQSLAGATRPSEQDTLFTLFAEVK